MCVGCNFPDSPLSVRELWRKYIQYISMKCTLSDKIKICMRFRNRWKSDYVRTLWQIVLKWAEPSVIPIVSRCTLPRPGYSLAGYYCLLYMIQISGACLTVIFILYQTNKAKTYSFNFIVHQMSWQQNKWRLWVSNFRYKRKWGAESYSNLIFFYSDVLLALSYRIYISQFVLTVHLYL